MTSGQINLTFVNRSGDPNNSQVVIFQHNSAPGADSAATAWNVIDNCGPGGTHNFAFPLEFEVSARSSDIGDLPALPASPGRVIELSTNSAGSVLQVTDGKASDPDATDVRMSTDHGAADILALKDGKVLAISYYVPPQDRVSFEFGAELFIGAVGEINEGDLLEGDKLRKASTKLDLTGIKKADIVMSGSGPDFSFELQNVER
ncbi:MAG: hypothetical protein JXR13_06980 [Thalassovita sp.]